MKKSKTTLLVIGDIKDWDSFLKLHRQRSLLKQYGIEYKHCEYDPLLSGDLPDIHTERLIIYLFFPFEFWDRYIEPKKYNGLYGNREFYRKIVAFWKRIDTILRRRYAKKKFTFINQPKNIPLERDKKATKDTLAHAGIPVPHTYRVKNAHAMAGLLEKGKKFFIKPRFGSMGKGITYVEKGKWYTNFGFKENTIRNRYSDYGWKFRKITGNMKFLKSLLKEDVMVEDAVPRWLIRGKHFDVRCLLFFGKIMYIYPRSNTIDRITTNVSQGARSEKMKFLKDVDPVLLRRTERIAVKAARILNLNYAGVDLILDPVKHEAIVIEINGFPGFPKVRTYNLGKYILHKIGEKYGNT
ncbi:RimK family alpha-L-glutamate ligase [Spirochaetota bacterium]